MTLVGHSKSLTRADMLSIHSNFVALMESAHYLKDKEPEEVKKAEKLLGKLEKTIEEMKKEGRAMIEAVKMYFDYDFSLSTLQEYVDMVKQEKYDEAVEGLHKECGEWEKKWDGVMQRI